MASRFLSDIRQTENTLEWTSKGSGLALGSFYLLMLILVATGIFAIIRNMIHGDWGISFLLMFFLPVFYVIFMEFAFRTRVLIETTKKRIQVREECLMVRYSSREIPLSAFSEIRVGFSRITSGTYGNRGMNSSYEVYMSGSEAEFQIECEGLDEDYPTASEFGGRLAAITGIPIIDGVRKTFEACCKINGSEKEEIMSQIPDSERYENFSSDDWKNTSYGEICWVAFYLLFIAPGAIIAGYLCIREVMQILSRQLDINAVLTMFFGIFAIVTGCVLILAFLQSFFGYYGFTIERKTGKISVWKSLFGLKWQRENTNIEYFDVIMIHTRMSGRNIKRKLINLTLFGPKREFSLRSFSCEIEALKTAEEVGVFLDIRLYDKTYQDELHGGNSR